MMTAGLKTRIYELREYGKIVASLSSGSRERIWKISVII